MTRIFLIVLALLFPSFALAQAEYCQPGTRCVSRDFNSTKKGGAAVCAQGPNAAWSFQTGLSTAWIGWASSSDTRCSAAGTALINMSINEDVVTSKTTGGWRSGTQGFQATDGTLALCGFNFASDPNTGFYRSAADTFSAVAGGAAIVTWRTIGSQYINGSAATPSIHFNGNSSTGLYYDATGGVGLTQAGTSLMSFQRAATTAFSSQSKTFSVDDNSGRAYHSTVAPSAVAPPTDLGGFPHPVTQRALYGLDMGYESNATPTFYPVAPRVGGSAATVTPVDAAAAVTQVLGAAPVQIEARGSVTLASAGSISSMITTAFIRRTGAAPRWCQRVSISATTTVRVWLGIASALPGSNDNPANSGQSFRYSTDAGDTAWMYCYANGVGSTCTTTGVAPSSGTATFDTLCIDCREGGTVGCTWWVNGVARARVTSGLGSGYPFFPYYSVEARAASARTLYAGRSSVEIY